MVPRPPAVPDALARVDEVIRELEAQRNEALAVLKNAEGVAAEQVYKAIRKLEDKLVEVRTSREQGLTRLKDTARLKEINETLKPIRAELNSGQASASRCDELQRRREALEEEGKLLVARMQTRRAKE